MTPSLPVSLAVFDNERGTLNYITPEKVVAAANLVHRGRHVASSITPLVDASFIVNSEL